MGGWVVCFLESPPEPKLLRSNVSKLAFKNSIAFKRYQFK